jgi:hypothetical protein
MTESSGLIHLGDSQIAIEAAEGLHPMMSNKITVYTSISPSLRRTVQGEEIGPAYQDACLNSWKEAGFRIVSLNCDSEIHELKKREIAVEFVSNGSQSERSKIASLLSLIAKSGNGVAAIINGDCLLIHYGEFIETVSRSALESIVLLERLNLAPATLRPTGAHCYGFDGFFFDTRFIVDLESTDSWLIGEPFWDYWFPLSLIHAGARLKMPDAPSLIHVNHEIGWRWGAWGASLTALRTNLLSWKKLESAFPKDFVTAVRMKQTKMEFVNFVFSWLRSTAERVRLSSEGTEGELLYRFLASLSESKEQQFQNELRQLQVARWARFKFKALRATLPRLHKLPLDPRDEVLE